VMRVLVVEDSRTQAMALCEELERAGFGVVVAGGGAEALTQVEAEKFDVIVSDIVMPDIDGYEFCRRLKEEPRFRGTPVVLLTSLTDPLDVVRALESGADNFMRKPYQPEQLIARLYAAGHNRELREGGRSRMGVQLSFMDRVFDITADRQQILDLLISTFEELVVTSRAMRDRESDLADANSALEQHLHAVDLAHGRLQAVMDSVPEPLFVLAPNGCVTHISEASAQALGATTADMLGRPLDDVVRFVDKDGASVSRTALPHHQAMRLGRRASAGTAFDLFIDGPEELPVPVVLYASPVLDADGELAGCVGTAHVLDSLRDHDPLTGLPNSAAFLNTIKALASSHASSALLLLELDRFDVTRVSRDGAASDEALVEVSRRLEQLFAALPGSDSQGEGLLAYLGGYRFGVVLPNPPDSFSILHLAEAARRHVASIGVGNDPLRLSASVGVALTERGHPGPALLAAAGAALQRARQAGGDRVEVFGQAASQDAIERLHLEIDLRTALETGGIELHYQPEVDLATGKILGFEALARWQHEQLGPVDPARFISVAEESGLIVSLGRRILAEACRRARLWQDAFGDGLELTMAVNVSAKQLRTEFVEEVVEVLQETGLDPRRLTLELTETAAMSEPETSLPILRELAGLGVRLALDDFGTGYSSLAYLTQIRFDQLKLDRGFVKGVTDGGSDAIVAQSIIALGDSLGVPVLAEGIEQPQQAEVLRQFGCDQGQGYLFGRPVDAESAGQLLESSRDRRHVLQPGDLPSARTVRG
jgi:EAL domain-containing protein (putative c-di-GMP-specific phosphodiesterase class I)/PleD family two-component response regulator